MLDPALRPLFWAMAKTSAICGVASAALLLLLTLGAALLKAAWGDERVHWENVDEMLAIAAAFAVGASLLIFLSGLAAVMRRRTDQPGQDGPK
jgi:hypothetical protein